MRFMNVRYAICAYHFVFFSLVLRNESTIWQNVISLQAKLGQETFMREANMTRDELNRELRMHSATWPAVLTVYGAIVGTLVVSALSII